MQKTLTKTANSIWMLAVAFLVFSMTCCSVAQAQVQPVYIRPSKGAQVQAIAQTATFPAVSAVYDFTAFDSAFITLTCVSNCEGGVNPDARANWEVVGAFAAAGPFSKTTIDDVYKEGQTPQTTDGNSFSFRIGGLPPFVKFGIVSQAFPATGQWKMTIIPLPLSDIKKVTGVIPNNSTTANSGAPAPVLIGGVSANLAKVVGMRGEALYMAPTNTTVGLSSASTNVTNAATRVFASNVNVCSVYIVNRNTTPVYCSTTNAVLPAAGIPLNAAGGANLAGGSFTFDNYGGDVYCITTAGTSDVTAQPFYCTPF